MKTANKRFRSGIRLLEKRGKIKMKHIKITAISLTFIMVLIAFACCLRPLNTPAGSVEGTDGPVTTVSPITTLVGQNTTEPVTSEPATAEDFETVELESIVI